VRGIVTDHAIERARVRAGFDPHVPGSTIRRAVEDACIASQEWGKNLHDTRYRMTTLNDVTVVLALTRDRDNHGQWIITTVLTPEQAYANTQMQAPKRSVASGRVSPSPRAARRSKSKRRRRR
jgi:hypothetical protein